MGPHQGRKVFTSQTVPPCSDGDNAGQSSPIIAPEEEDTAEQEQPDEAGDTEDEDDTSLLIDSVIEHSPESARIILFSSSDFLRDRVSNCWAAPNAQSTSTPCR